MCDVFDTTAQIMEIIFVFRCKVHVNHLHFILIFFLFGVDCKEFLSFIRDDVNQLLRSKSRWNKAVISLLRKYSKEIFTQKLKSFQTKKNKINPTLLSRVN